jgi:uncharacterized protein YbaR (Trm112 family)
MTAALVELLCCPFCGGDLTADRGNGSPTDILHCRCGDYPVVAGISIIKKRVAFATRTRIAEVIKLIEAGRDQEALMAVLLPPPPAAATRAPASVDALRKWRERAAALFSRYLDTTFSCLLKSDGLAVHDLRHKYTSGDRIVADHQGARDATAGPWRA